MKTHNVQAIMFWGGRQVNAWFPHREHNSCASEGTYSDPGKNALVTVITNRLFAGK